MYGIDLDTYSKRINFYKVLEFAVFSNKDDLRLSFVRDAKKVLFTHELTLEHLRSCGFKDIDIYILIRRFKSHTFSQISNDINLSKARTNQRYRTFLTKLFHPRMIRDVGIKIVE